MKALRNFLRLQQLRLRIFSQWSCKVGVDILQLGCYMWVFSLILFILIFIWSGWGKWYLPWACSMVSVSAYDDFFILSVNILFYWFNQDPVVAILQVAWVIRSLGPGRSLPFFFIWYSREIDFISPTDFIFTCLGGVILFSFLFNFSLVFQFFWYDMYICAPMHYRFYGVLVGASNDVDNYCFLVVNMAYLI